MRRLGSVASVVAVWSWMENPRGLVDEVQKLGATPLPEPGPARQPG